MKHLFFFLVLVTALFACKKEELPKPTADMSSIITENTTQLNAEKKYPPL